MIGFLLPIFARWGVAERFRKPLGYLALAIAAIALLSLLRAIYDHKVISDHETQREAAASGAREKAADEAATDTIITTRNEKDLHDAIDQANTGAGGRMPLADGRISPAAHALACERLRKIGRLPEACRSQGGGGAQAGAD